MVGWLVGRLVGWLGSDDGYRLALSRVGTLDDEVTHDVDTAYEIVYDIHQQSRVKIPTQKKEDCTASHQRCGEEQEQVSAWTADLVRE